MLQAIKRLEMEEMITLTEDISQADAFLALHSKLKKNPHIQAFAKAHDKPIFVTKTNSLVQITRAIRALINLHADGFKACVGEVKVCPSEKADALEEARSAIEQVVVPRGKSVQLLPRPSHIISLQTDLIERYKLKWELVGQEPSVSLRILPLQAGIEEKFPDLVVGSSSTFEDFSSCDGLRSLQDGVTRLPLLPE